MAVRKAKPAGRRSPARQVGALPVRRTADGVLEVLLISSRETRRWIIPKGWPMKGRAPAEAAATEALEEAGVAGTVARERLGFYRYDKVLPKGRAVLCTVSVFRLDVTEEHGDWKERAERRRRWMRPQHAAAIVKEPELKAILLRLAAQG